MIGETISHYRILAKLGQGGMGIVYQAADTKLDRSVALKFLAPELTRDPEARARFILEAKAAAALNHPNIATIYEIDDAGGQTFIAMEFVPGTSLRDRIAAGPLPNDEAVEITTQIAWGLQRAHSQGIVHRDIKPGNILLSPEGEVKIVDFGLATLAGQTRLTRTGTTLGTVHYMSPEQACGQEVTHQTDIWALGVVHYEMLTGRLPFRGDNPQAQIYSILNTNPEPISDLVPDVPDFHDLVTRQALAKDPSERFQSAQDLVRALQDQRTTLLPTAKKRPAFRRLSRRLPTGTLWIGISLLFAAALILGTLLTRTRGKSDFRARDWLLVTEFKDYTSESNLQTALREALIIDMQQSRYVNVFSGKRLSDALTRMGKTIDDPLTAELGNEIALREAIPVVLSGSVSTLGDAFLVAAQLVDPKTGEALFATRVQAEDQQALYPAIDELSRAIRETLGESLHSIRSADAPLASVTTASLEALRLYSQGNQAFLASDWSRAITLLNQAVAVDSTFAMAHAKLARIYYYNANTLDALNFSDKAYRWRERLTHRERYYIEGEYHRYRTQYTEAIASLRTLLEEYPDDLESRTNLATTSIWNLQFREAQQELEKFDPASRQTWFYYHTLGNVYGGLGEFQSGVAEFQQALTINPTQLRSRMCMSWNYICMGDMRAAWVQLDSLANAQKSGAISTDYLLAKTFVALGDFPRTLDHITAARNKALANNNQNQVAWTHIYEGFCHDLRSDYAAAIQSFTSAIKIWPGNFPLLHLGKSYARSNDFVRAEQVVRRLEELVQTEPTNSNRHFLLKLKGAIALQRGDYPQVISLLLEGVPNILFNLDAHFTLGRAYLEMGNLDAAREEFELVIGYRYPLFLECVPFLWPLSHYYLGHVAEKAGDSASSIEQYETFLNLWKDADTGIPEVEDAHHRIEILRD